jgi:hypothetical protein
MNYIEFKELEGKEKEKIVNEWLISGKALEDFAKSVGKGRSTIEKCMYEHGYRKERNGLFYLVEDRQKENLPEATGELLDLIKHKETLIELAKRIESLNELVIDFTPLKSYEKGDDSRFTIRMKEQLKQELQAFSEKSKVNHNDLISLAIFHLLQVYK